MATTGVSTLDGTVQETNVWLGLLMIELGTEDRHRAYEVLRATLHALRDRVGPENAVHLGAQLPILVRGVFYERWQMAKTPTKERHVKDFLDHVRRELPEALAIDVETAVRAVFKLLWQRLDPGETAKLARILPAELRSLWPETVVLQ